MREYVSRRVLLSRTGGAIAVSIALGGCLGGGGGTDDGDGPHEEPDEYPPGVQADGIDVERLQDTIEPIIQEESFSYEGFGRRLNMGTEQREVEAIRVTADNAQEIGFIIEGERPGELNDPLNAPRVEKFYAEGDQAFEVVDFGTPESVDGGFDTIIDVAMDHLNEVIEHLADLGWGTPSWDAQEGYYAIPAADIDAIKSSVNSATLHVDAAGVPVGAVGQVDRADGRIDVEINFTPDVEVSRPDWVADAF